jgi:1-acyl-sn-glycerol-3-phosphate acyltransferase
VSAGEANAGVSRPGVSPGDDARLRIRPHAFGITGFLRNLVIYVFSLYSHFYVSICFVPLWFASFRPRGRRLLFILFQTWLECFLLIFGVRVHVDGLRHVTDGGPCLIVCNHRSWMDIIVLVTALKHDRNIIFMLKRSLMLIPIYGWYIGRLGFIPVDRQKKGSDNRAQIKRSADALLAGETLVIFPEGTRAPTHRFVRFKKGAAEVALLARARVVPAVISGSAQVFPKGTPFVRPGTVRVEFLEPIVVNADTNRDALLAAAANAMTARYRPDANENPAENDPAFLDAIRADLPTSTHM